MGVMQRRTRLSGSGALGSGRSLYRADLVADQLGEQGARLAARGPAVPQGIAAGTRRGGGLGAVRSRAERDRRYHRRRGGLPARCRARSGNRRAAPVSRTGAGPARPDGRGPRRAAAGRAARSGLAAAETGGAGGARSLAGRSCRVLAGADRRRGTETGMTSPGMCPGEALPRIPARLLWAGRMAAGWRATAGRPIEVSPGRSPANIVEAPLS